MKKSIFLFFAAILCAMSVQSANTMRIYCKQAQSWWKSDDAAVGAHYWGTAGDGTSWPGTRMTKVSGQTDLWYIDVDIDKYQSIIFTRVPGSGAVSDWGAKTGDLTIENTKNQYTISSSSAVWGNPGVEGSWGTYKPTSTASLATSSANIFVGGQATLTSSLTSNTDANTLGSTTYTINPTTGASITGNTFTATAEGTYTVTATITYYPLGCPSLTSTATASTTITASVPAEETNNVTVSYKFGTTEIATATTIASVGVETPSEATAPAITGYTFANWTLGAGVATEDELTANPIDITTKSGETDYTLTANYNKIQLTYNVTVPAGSKGCYIAGDMNSWGFTEMTKVDDTHYTITIDGATAEHKYKYASSGEWKYVEVKEDGGDVDDRTYSENDVVAKWKAMPGVYLAGGMNGWNTTANEFVDGTLSIDLAASSTIEFKIVKDGDWLGNGEEIKADNCENVSIGTGGNNCKIVTGVAGSYTFTWDNTNTQLSVTYPAGVAEDVYTIVGAATLVGSEWNTSDTNNDMEKQSDGSYKLVKEDVVLAAGTYDYKVIKNHSYDWSIPEGNSNQQLPISTSAKYDVTFVLSSDLTTLTATATFIESVDVTPDCYLSGNEALTGQDWGTHDELKMTYESSTETYSITLNNLAAATAFEMKVVYNGSWLGFNDLATTPDGVKNSGGNISFQLAAEGSLTVTYNVTNGITLTGNFYVPDYSNQPNIIYFHPSTEWKKDGARFAAYFFDAESKWISMTDNDGDGVYEVANEKKNEKVIFCSMKPDNLTNDWEQKIHQTQDLTIPNTADDPNICYAFWQNSLESNDGTWVAPTPLTVENYETIISTYGDKTVNIVVERQFADEEWHTICLPFTYAADWFGKAYQLGSLINNGPEGITITTKECKNIEAGKPYLLKPNKTEGYDHVILSDVQVPTSVTAGTNSVTGAGYTVTLTANLKNNGTTTTEYWVGNGGYLYNDGVSKLGLRSYFTIPPVSSGMPPRFRVVTGENEATGIEDIITTDAPVKVIENGQLIIIRNGEKFNVQGQKL